MQYSDCFKDAPEEKVCKVTLHRPSGQLSSTLFQRAQKIASEFNWPAGSFIIVTHLLVPYCLFVTPYYYNTLALNIVLMFSFFFCITAGYHRLWAHRTYEANAVVKALLALLGTGAFSMPVIDWVKDHRTHHKFTDTDKDPYDSTKGFWYCHIGWLFKARKLPNADVRDLEADPVLRFQLKYFIHLAFLVGLIIPTLISGLVWNDWEGGLYISIIRIVIVHHVIFSINSLAHWYGDLPFSNQSTARDNVIVAIITCGEGYHNFHHEFPNDYRNGVKWFAFDPTKWLIAGMEIFGLSWGLKRTPEEVIAKAEIQTMMQTLQEKKKQYFWGKQITSLPTYTRESVQKEVMENNASLVILDNIVYDVAEFLPMHPGGASILKSYLGKDATKAFNGGVYKHTCSARDILDTLRVGVICNS